MFGLSGTLAVMEAPGDRDKEELRVFKEGGLDPGGGNLEDG